MVSIGRNYISVGYNPIWVVIAYILHLPFLFTYAAISLGVPAMINIFFGICLAFTYAIIGAENQSKLLKVIAYEFNKAPSLAYDFIAELIKVIKQFNTPLNYVTPL